MIDLHHELIRAQASPRVVPTLARYGVAAFIAEHCGMARADISDNFYQPGDDGTWAIICPVMQDDDLVDCIAFDPRTPERWWQRTGDAALLGNGALDDLVFSSDPLNLYATPLAWLQGGGQGAVLLRPERVHVLIGVQRIETDDGMFAIELDRWFSTFTRPQILVRAESQAA